MAINFLNKVDLNQNELDHARIVNEAGNTAAGTGVSWRRCVKSMDKSVG